ncbi:ATP-binding cassette sub-family C member 5-like [Haemaphysalis longicornis]
MSGACLPLALLCSVARAVAVAVFLCWIKMWIDASSTMDNGGRSNSTWVTVLAILCLCDLVFGSLGGCLLALSFRRLSSRLHYAMLRSLLRCPISFFDTTPRGRVLNRFSADIDSVDCQLFMTSKEVFQTISVTMARLAVIGTQAALACGFGVVATCVYIVVVAITVRASNDLRFLENAWTSRVLQHLTETRDSMSSVRCYGAVKLVCRHFYRLVDGATRPFWATTACVRFARVSGGAAGLFAVLALVLTVGLSASPPSQSGVGLALSAAISIPMFLSNVNAALFFAFVAAISFERAVEYTRLPAEDDCTGISQTYKNTTGANGVCRQGPLKSWPTEGKVVFDSVTACYNEDGLSPALKDVSFVIQAREKVGVVGRTGAGKSSLILALLRVLKPSKGRIIIDGVDVACVSLRQLRSVVTVIPQEPYLMKGTLRDNLDATKCHSDQQVWEALRRAHMEDFVAKLPQGLLFDISEGAENLSAGQRQLLCLARALLRSPRVLLLDEATSRMDGDTDRMIQQTLRDGFSACTVVTIAHRLHTILHCDRILVMSEGSVVEHGSVADLAVNPNSAFRAMARAAGIDLATITTDHQLSPRL